MRWNTLSPMHVRALALSAALLLSASACSSASTPTPAAPASTPAPAVSALAFPSKFPSGTELRITMWSHFIPGYDQWFDAYAAEWGRDNGVNVVVQHIPLAGLASTLGAAIAAGTRPTLIQMDASPAQFIEGLQDLTDANAEAQRRFGQQAESCRRQSFLPKKTTWYGFCHGWVVDPGDYRISLWARAGYPNGPSTYQELLDGGRKIKQQLGVPVGVGMRPEIDSELAARSMMWIYGGAIQNEQENVVMNSPQVVEAVKFMTALYQEAMMTPEVFRWEAASNNQAFIGAQAARGEKTPEKAVADAAAQIERIFAKWRAKGYVGGG